VEDGEVLPGGKASVTLATIAYGSSKSGTACRMASSVTGTAFAEVKQLSGLTELPKCRAGRRRCTPWPRAAAGQQRAGVREHDRVVVHVDDP
jgi:hypothetical protein